MDLIRDQGDRQLDLIGRINTTNTRGIEFGGERSKELKKLEDRIIEEERKNIKKDFSYITTNRDIYDFNKYSYLMNYI